MRCVLIIHPDETRRREIRAAMGEIEVLEAASRESAVPILKARAPSLVVSHHLDFKRLLRDLERHAPGATRAVLCPQDNHSLRSALVDVAAHGYDFETLDDRALEKVHSLVQGRRSARRKPLSTLLAQFLLQGETLHGTVEEIGNEGLNLTIAPSASATLRLFPGASLERASVSMGEVPIMEPRSWVVRSVLRSSGLRVGIGFHTEPLQRDLFGMIGDEVRIRGLLRRAAARGVPFELQHSDGLFRRRFQKGEISRSGERLSLHQPTPDQPFRVGQVVRLSFELGGQQHEGMALVVESCDQSVTVASPDQLRRHHRRATIRARAANGLRAGIVLRSALDNTVVSRPLLDLHPSGAAFTFAPDTEVFPVGLILTDVTIEVEGKRVQCNATVQGTAPAVSDENPWPDGRRVWRCGLRLHQVKAHDAQVLRDAVARVLEPSVSDGSNASFETIWSLFASEAGPWLDHPFADARTTAALADLHRRLADGASGLCKTFLYFEENGALTGHASGLRTHSRTWLSQHLLVRAGYHRAHHVSQMLVNLSFDYGELLPDVEYMRGLWRTKNRWAARVFGSATARLIKPGLSYLASYTPMRRALRPNLPPGALQARAAEDADLGMVLRHLRLTEDPVRLAADDLVEGEARLESLGQRYEAHGLHRSREFGIVDGRSGPRGFVSVQLMSPGLFWAEMYTSFRLHLIEPEAADSDEVRLALVTWATEVLRRHGRRIGECHASDDDMPLLERLGFDSLGRVMEFGAHRSLTREMTTQMLAVFERLEGRAHDAEDTT